MRTLNSLTLVIFIVLFTEESSAHIRWRNDVRNNQQSFYKQNPPQTTNNYWQTSAPNFVNLIYTWLHPQQQQHTPISINLPNPMGLPSPPQVPQHNYEPQTHQSQNNVQKYPEDSEENEDSGEVAYNLENKFSCRANRYRSRIPSRDTYMSHPHFGRWAGYEGSSNVYRVAEGIYAVERGSQNTLDHVIYFSKFCIAMNIVVYSTLFTFL